MPKNENKHLRPDSLTSPSSESVASGYRQQIIEDRYLDLDKVKAYMKKRWPTHDCKVKVKLGKFILTIPKDAKDIENDDLNSVDV